MDPKKPYNKLSELSPSFQASPEIHLQCGKSNRALAELKGAINTLHNPRVLINTIPLLETHSSNEIENIVTTQDSLFRSSALDNSTDPATKEALRYRTALRKAFKKPITISLMKEICSTIHDKPMDLREEWVCIRSRESITYTPPDDHKIISKLLENWIEFSHHPDLDPLIKMAMLHYQFEAIHPFKDGNGRTGRILNLIFLIQEGLLDSPVLYLSRYILEHRSKYYELLRKVTEENDWEEWIMYMLKAVEETSVWTLKHVEAIKKLRRNTKMYLKENLKTPYRNVLLDILFTYPYCRAKNIPEHEIKSRMTKVKYLRELVKLGVLKEEKIGRESIFIHSKYLNLLMSPEHEFSEY